MSVIRILLCCALGIAVGLMAFQAYERGYPQLWARMPPVPGTPAELIATGHPPFYVRAADGNTYLYTDSHGWVVEAVQRLGEPAKFGPCHPGFLELTLPDVRPNTVKQCIEVETIYADGGIDYGVVLDSAGNIWKTERTTTAADLPTYLAVMCGCPGGGLLIGLTIALTWNHYAAWRKAAGK